MRASTSSGVTAGSAKARRVGWIDIARGIGILLVVYGHALRSLYTTHAPATGWPAWQDSLIYAFHMPLFFVLSGLFVEYGLARGKGKFVRDKLITIAWPYFLWSLITGLTELLADRWVNTPISLGDVALIPIAPIEQYWFLYVLFVNQLILCVLFPRRWLMIAAAGLGILLAATIGSGNIFARSLIELPYMVAGVILGAWLIRTADWPIIRQIALGMAAWIVFALLHFGALAGFTLPASYGAAFAGTLGTVMLSMALARAGIGRTLALLGRASMAIFVMHTLASAGLRILLTSTGMVRDPAILLPLITAAGVIAPLLVLEACRRLDLNAIMGLGRNERAAAPRPATPVTS